MGISSGVVDPRRARGGLDGIGTYTEALLAHLGRPGLAVKRVDTMHVSGRGRALPRHADVRLALPLPITIALGAVAHARTPDCGVAKGLPIIASEVPVCKELGGHLVAQVDARDTRALTNAMASFAQTSIDEVERAKRIAHAMPYTWRALAERTVAVYREFW